MKLTLLNGCRFIKLSNRGEGEQGRNKMCGGSIQHLKCLELKIKSTKAKKKVSIEFTVVFSRF